MNFRVFQYPLPAPEELADLNRFLSAHKVASVTREVVTLPGGGAMLLFVVETAHCGGAVGAEGPFPGAGKGRRPEPGRVDYKEVLPETDFAVFSDLRNLRAQLAKEAGGVPPFSVFNNEQLAAMVTARMRTVAEVAGIPGVSEGKAAKYGEAFLNVIREAFPESSATTLPA
jgi:hypothetical protein